MHVHAVSQEDILLEFHNGFAQAELLPGVYPGGVHAWRCVLQAGHSVAPQQQENTIQVLCLTDGIGAVLTQERAYAVNEVSFFVPDPGAPFSLHAATDLTYTMFVVEQKEGDQKRFEEFHVRLPMFKPLSQCTEYCQSCKSPTSRSFSVIPTKRLCRILMGVGEAYAQHSDQPEGCFEKGHPAVAQWNVPFGNTQMRLTVDGESVVQKGGDFSYVPAGLDHSLECLPGQEIHYIWFEHYVLEKDYLVSYPRA